MTATAPPPRTLRAGPDQDSLTPLRIRRDQSVDPLGPEVALGIVTLVAALGLGRLFDDRTVLIDIALAAVVAHVVAAVTRRLGWGLVLSWAGHLVAATLVVSWTRYPDLLTWGVPTPITFDAMGEEASAAWDAFQVVIAPTPPLPGFIVASMVGVWIVAAVADLGAFRARLPGQALAPSAVLVVFVGALGVPDWRVLTAGGYAAAAIAFLLIERVGRTPALTEAAQRRRTVRLGAGAALVASAALLGAIAGPLLPGLDDEALIDPTSLDSGNGTLLTLSPLVDIRGRLLNQAPVEVFTVEADEAAYWRTTALDDFDGAVWGFSGTYSDAGGDLPVELPDVASRVNRQVFTISGLADIWLPAGYLPIRIDQGDVKFDEASSTIIRQSPSAGRFTYSVVSASLQFEAQRLIAADGPIPGDIMDRYTALPDDFSPVVRRQADEIVAGVTNTYEKMRKLQDFFVGNFTYDITVGAGHGANRTERFLIERRGYCEQFAGTFAAMARHLGVPARVAVGFTWGEPTGDGSFVVRGEHYHAWPEVYFAGSGWVPFEPTPGRGAPGAQSWTGRDEAQANGTPLPVTTTTTEAGSGLLPDLADQVPDFEDLAPGAGSVGPATNSGGGSDGLVWLARILAVVAGAAAIAAAWIGAVALLRRRRRHRRRAQAADDAARVEAAWQDLVESLGLDGLVPHEAETRRDFARRIGANTALPTDRLDRVAVATDHASFGSGRRLDRVVSVVNDDVEILEHQLRSGHTRGEAILRMADPRPLLRSWPKRRPGSP